MFKIHPETINCESFPVVRPSSRESGSRQSIDQATGYSAKENKSKTKRGFTLIEVIISVAIIAVLAVVITISKNPGEYFAKERDIQREKHLVAVLNAVGQRIADNKGVFEVGCAVGVIPASSTKMATGVGNYDVGQCLVPAYLPAMPYDPKASGAHWISTTDYDTGYNISKDATTGRITVSAPSAELEAISYTR